MKQKIIGDLCIYIGIGLILLSIPVGVYSFLALFAGAIECGLMAEHPWDYYPMREDIIESYKRKCQVNPFQIFLFPFCIFLIGLILIFLGLSAPEPKPTGDVEPNRHALPPET
jgi:hypothetical protein